jgi:hypothetical protein
VAGCSETKNWKMNLTCKSFHEEIIHLKIICCNNGYLLKDIGKYVFIVLGKCQKE